MKFYIVAVEGNWCDRLKEVAQAWGKTPVGRVQLFKDWASVASSADEPGLLVAALSGEWTVLCQYRFAIDLLDDALMASMQARLRARIVTALGYSTTGDYAFRLWTAEGLLRSLSGTNDENWDNRGLLPGESPEEHYGPGDAEYLLDLVGIDIADGVENCSRSAVLRYADDPKRK